MKQCKRCDGWLTDSGITFRGKKGCRCAEPMTDSVETEEGRFYPLEKNVHGLRYWLVLDRKCDLDLDNHFSEEQADWLVQRLNASHEPADGGEKLSTLADDLRRVRLRVYDHLTPDDREIIFQCMLALNATPKQGVTISRECAKRCLRDRAHFIFSEHRTDDMNELQQALFQQESGNDNNS